MQISADMQRGWEFAASTIGGSVSAQIGSQYVKAVQQAIHQLENSINTHPYRNLGINQLQGYLFEKYAAGTFNIDAVAFGSHEKARIPNASPKNSADIELNSGKQYSAKSYNTPERTLSAQAKIDSSSREISYYKQYRLVPSDQLERIKIIAHNRTKQYRLKRPDLSNAYSETKDKLTDTVQNNEGVSSKKVTRSELEDIAKDSKDSKFKAEKHDITTNQAIKQRYALKKAAKAGLTSAAITAAIELAPEVFKAIDYLIKNREIDLDQLGNMGKKALSTGAEAFLNGSLLCYLKVMCEKGTFGKPLKTISPSTIGTTVVLITQTIKNSILVAQGQKAPKQMGSEFIDALVLSGTRLLRAKIVGGVIGEAVIPVFGYLLGTLIGASFDVIYGIGKKKLISFCSDTGFTCFGLVDQDYTLPEEIIKELGIETIPIPRTNIEQVEIPRVQTMTTQIDRIQYETISFSVLRRGVIGVNKIRYTLA